MSFLGSIFGGQNPTLNKNINKFGQEGDFAQSVGEGDVTAASDFYKNILSGDPTAEATAIAPEAKAAQDQLQQMKNSTAQFGTRSGGNTASVAASGGDLRAKILAMLGGLKTGAASGAAGLGTGEQGVALESQGMQDQASQQQMMNWMNSILGKSINGAINYGESFLPVAHSGG